MKNVLHPPSTAPDRETAVAEPGLARIAGGLALPVAAGLPGLVLRLGGWHVPPVVAAVAFAAAVVAAAFLLTWGTSSPSST